VQRQLASRQLETALRVDPTFCLTFAIRSQTRAGWRERVDDALAAIRYAPRCGDVFFREGLTIAVHELARASDEALEANEGPAFEQLISAAAESTPTLEVYTTLANYLSKAGRIREAIAAVDRALAQIPAEDTTTSQRYKDFRFTLVQMQEALEAAQSAPNDVELQKEVARQWLARGQFDFALAAFEKVLALKPDDYAAQRNVALILIAAAKLDAAKQAITRVQPLAPDGGRTQLLEDAGECGEQCCEWQ
jgi:tetratricopeptide (TPR) repeat protein